MTNEKNIFEKIEGLKLTEDQIESLVKFSAHTDDYNRMFIAINEFITDLEPKIDRNKIKQKTEDLLRSYPLTLISDLNATEKWYLFNDLAHLYLTMAITSIETL